MGKGKGWCLLANYADRSLLRNRIVYNLAEETGIPFTMDSRNIDLYINGDYMGSYLITEKSKSEKRESTLRIWKMPQVRQMIMQIWKPMSRKEQMIIKQAHRNG